MDYCHHQVDRVKSKVFAERVGVELNRAERYSVFVSLTLVDLGFSVDDERALSPEVREGLGKCVRKALRACDYAGYLDNNRLALLFPETARQGAEIAARRVTQVVGEYLAQHSSVTLPAAPSLEITSYPDTAGARTMEVFLADLTGPESN